jgi:hypothetical protein
MSNIKASTAEITNTGDMTVDTDTLKVDSTNDRVGIGTITPSHKLTVAGDIKLTTGSIIFADTTSISSASSVLSGSGSTGYLAYWDGTSSLTYDTGQLFWDAINNRLGIGNAAPSTALHVTGTITTTALSASGTVAGSNLSGTNTGDLTLTAIGASANANGASISGQVLNLQPASASFGGVVTTGTQSFAGAKTFTGAISASNLSGTNTGDLTLGSIGASPNAQAASLSGQVLTIQPASASFGGVLTTGTQTIAGGKTFSAILTASAGLTADPLYVSSTQQKAVFGSSIGYSKFEITSANSANPTTTSSNINSLSNAGTGSITVVSTSGWPSAGAFAVDDEIMGYNAVTATTITVSQRSLFGTTGTTHAVGSTLKPLLFTATTATSVTPKLCITTDGAIGFNSAAQGTTTYRFNSTPTATSGTVTSMYHANTATPATASSATFVTRRTDALTSGANNFPSATLISAQNRATLSVTGGLSTMVGTESANSHTGGGGTLTTSYGFLNNLAISSGGTVTTGYGYYAASPTGAGTLSNYRGFFVADSSATNTIGIYGNISSGANKWNIYAGGTAQNYFAGNVGIGSSVPGYLLHVAGSTAVTTGSDISATRTEYTIAPPGTTSALTAMSHIGRIVTQSNAIDHTGTQIRGSTLEVAHYGTATLGIAMGSVSQLSNTTTGTITATYGNYNQVTNASTGTIATAIGYYNSLSNASGTVTNYTGYYQPNFSSLCSIAVGLRSLNAAGTNKWNLYIDGTAQNYFVGNVGIGIDAPTEKLEIASGNILLSNGQSYKIKNSAGTAVSVLGVTGGDNLQITTPANAGGLQYFVANATGAHQFLTNGTIRLTIASAGTVQFTEPNEYSGATGITAFAGGGQGSATALTKEVNFVTTVATTGDSVKLPTGALGKKIVVFNQGANAADVFPASGGQIDALGTNTAYSIAAGGSREFYAQTTTQWYSR